MADRCSCCLRSPMWCRCNYGAHFLEAILTDGQKHDRETDLLRGQLARVTAERDETLAALLELYTAIKRWGAVLGPRQDNAMATAKAILEV